MCGRFQMNDDALGAACKIARIPKAVQQELNLGMIYPSKPSLVLVGSNKRLTGTLMDFGFQSDSLKKRIINARAESVGSKYMFKYALHHNRCIIPCCWFYEWDSQKQMISFDEAGHDVLYLAGIYIEGQFIILTINANASMEPFHDRMPLILPEDKVYDWVFQDEDTENLLHWPAPMLEHNYISRPQTRLFA